MLELSPYLIVAVFNLIKAKRGISEEEIIEHLESKTGIDSERIKSLIEKSISFLIESKLISFIPDEKKKYKKADKATLSISESISNGFTRKAKEIARRTISTIPGNKIRELVYYCEIAGVTPVLLGEAAKERAIPIWDKIGK